MLRLRKNFFFISVCFSLTLLLVLTYCLFLDYFSAHNESHFEIGYLKSQIQKEKLNSELVRYQLKDYQQSVALALPDSKNLIDNHEQLRGIASVSLMPSNENPIDLSGVYFQRGKAQFLSKNYEAALIQFDKIITEFPMSIYTVEAYFFTAECYYLMKSYQKSLSIIDIMVSQFPDHRLTGFILLRMGQISEVQRHMAEALEIYRAVEVHFDQRELQIQARKMAENVETSR